MNGHAIVHVLYSRNYKVVMYNLLMHFLFSEAWLGGCSQMHKQEEFGQIPDSSGQRDQDIEGKFWF